MPRQAQAPVPVQVQVQVQGQVRAPPPARVLEREPLPALRAMALQRAPVQQLEDSNRLAPALGQAMSEPALGQAPEDKRSRADTRVQAPASAQEQAPGDRRSRADMRALALELELELECNLALALLWAAATLPAELSCCSERRLLAAQGG